MESMLGLAAQALRREKFSLVDIGCSGGIDAVWRGFGDRLAAIGFDASADEIRRLQAQETNLGISYIAGFVDIQSDHPFAKRARNLPVHVDTLFGRFSAGWAYDIERERRGDTEISHEQKFKLNQWMDTQLANHTISAPHILAERKFTDVDFLKIDVDGPDLRVLQSFDGLFGKLGILAARLEVCMFGGAGETVNSFHNTDRFMREQGYCLFRLDNRTYSNRALPSPFLYDFPAQTAGGRIFQAEAHYALDPAGIEWKSVADRLSDEKLIKLAAIFSVWDLPDSAAELLVTFRGRLSTLMDVDRALDVLSAQAQPIAPLPYRDYVALFAEDPIGFDPEPPPAPPTIFERIRAAWVALTDLPYIDKLRRC